MKALHNYGVKLHDSHIASSFTFAKAEVEYNSGGLGRRKMDYVPTKE
jgi:hypothetical protein